MLAPIQKSNYQLYKPPAVRRTKSATSRQLSNSLRSYSEYDSGLNRSRTLSERSTKSTASLLDVIGFRKKSPEAKRNRTTSTPPAASGSPPPKSVKETISSQRTRSPASPSRKIIPLAEDRTTSIARAPAHQLGRSRSLPANQRRRSSSIPLSETPEMDEIKDFPVLDRTTSVNSDTASDVGSSDEPEESSQNLPLQGQPEPGNKNVSISTSPDVPETGDLKLFRRRSDSNELRRLLAVKKLEQFRQEAGLADLEVMPALRELSQEQLENPSATKKAPLLKQRSWSMGDVPQFRPKQSILRRFLHRIRNAMSSSE